MRFEPGESKGQVVAGTGVKGSGPDELNLPQGVTMHPDGSMLVADRSNHRIMRFEPGESKGQVVAGTGVAGSGPDELNHPNGVTMHPDGSMLVADGSNHRTMDLDPGESKGQVVPCSPQENVECQQQAQRRGLEHPTVACETQGHLHSIFSAIDVEETGIISRKQIEVAIKALDRNLFPSEIIEAMLESEGLHQEAEVDFERFACFFQVHMSDTSEVVSGLTCDAVEEAKRRIHEKVQNLLFQEAQNLLFVKKCRTLQILMRSSSSSDGMVESDIFSKVLKKLLHIEFTQEEVDALTANLFGNSTKTSVEEVVDWFNESVSMTQL